MSINVTLAVRLEANPKDAYVTGVNILVKLLTNVIDNPKDEKYRRFKKTNQRISSELLSLDGMVDMLAESGFELDNDEFVLRRGGLGVISKLKTYRDFFQQRLEIVKQSPSTLTTSADARSSLKGAIQKVASASTKSESSTPPTTVSTRVSTVKITATKPFHERIRFQPVLRSENNFLRQLEQLSDSVMQYEDKQLQQSALQLIPSEKLKQQALEKLRKIQKLIKSKVITEAEPPLDDLILEELAEWFKNNFFTWINAMPCRVCKNQGTDAVGTRMEHGVRIERYMCNKNSCNTITEFPRYNDIAKLLVTRSGRCGEFANCFTFLCRCLGYDARYIYATCDHVWTEVYNHQKKRWIHIDPSENVFDSPLMYEHGWKRKLEYVIGFSKDDIQDVTWRYSNKHQELHGRRKLCTEKELIGALMELRQKRQSTVTAARKKFSTLRTLSELSELLIIREPTEDELKGRSSGSLSWRLGRGEANVSNFYVFTLNDNEKQSKQFNIRYSCARDAYERINAASRFTTSDWKTWTYQSENVFRKVEHDHKMAYLSRTEDSPNGCLQFKFDFAELRIKSIDLKLDTKTYENGNVFVEFIDENEKVLAKEKLTGASKFSIRVRLSGGKGDCAWQHAQVFRQPLTSAEFPFQLAIDFN